MIEIFKEGYCSESLCDLGRDIREAFDPVFNDAMKGIPQDEHGFHSGTFRVTIQWVPE